MNASLRSFLFACLPLAMASAGVPHAAWAQEVQLDRSVLPVAEPARPPITAIDARDAQVPPRFEVKAPAGAPNVVIVLIDDLGFGVPDTFGGPVPHADTGQTCDKTACATPTSTPRPCVRRRVRRSSPGATITP